MRCIHRLPKPNILEKNATQWTADFLKVRAINPQQRPTGSKYAHAEIKDYLARMGAHKCFYCERALSEKEFVIDHYIEVAERPDLAFEWENLYLCCKDCNSKMTNITLPNANTLDPCSDTYPHAEHISFDNEKIRSRDGSSRGLQTIQKYKLDRDDLNLQRMRALREFDKRLISLQRRLIAEGRKSLTKTEKEILESFKQAERPFSLMFAYYISQQDL